MSSIVETISTFLAAAGLSLVEGTNLFCHNWGIMGGDASVLITGASGPPPIRFVGDASSLKESHITILVRNTVFSTGLSKAQAIYTALDRATISGIITSFCDQSEPIFVNKEETETGSGKYRYYFSVNVTIKHM